MTRLFVPTSQSRGDPINWQRKSIEGEGASKPTGIVLVLAGRGNWTLSVGTDSVVPGDVYESLPVQRSPLLIAALIVFLVIFSMPYGMMFDAPAGRDDSFFDLIFFVFQLFFLMGWSVPVVGGIVLVLLLLFGRETVHARRGELRVKLDLFGVGFVRSISGELIGSWRWEVPDAQSPHRWRGPHILFDTLGEMDVRVGSALGEREANRLAERICERMRSGRRSGVDVADVRRKEKREPALAEASETVSVAPASAARASAATEQSLASLIALLIANIVPILGVMFFGWRIGEIMLIYWAESAIIGFYNLCKMAKVGGWAVLGIGPFFVGHFGGFMIVHLLFVYGLFVQDDMSTDISVGTVLQEFGSLGIALLALFVSHGISFYQNFLGRREYEGKTISAQMGEPYKRIVVMHLTIIFGGFLVMAFDDALPALFLMIVLKVITDMRAHTRVHDDRGKSA